MSAKRQIKKIQSNYTTKDKLEDKLTWKEHIDYVYKNIVKFVGIFYRIKHRLSRETLKMIYFAFVYCHQGSWLSRGDRKRGV